MSVSSQGCWVPDRSEVEAHARVGAPWTMSRDIPDVAGWQDLIAAPKETYECLERRITDGRCPMLPSVVSVPKLGSDELRKFTCLDPFDELWSRILLGKMVDPIEASLQGSAEVLSYRIVGDVPAWSVCSLKKVWPAFRNRSIKLLNQANCRAMGTFDIRWYYPSIAPDKIALMLARIGVRQDVVCSLERFLSDLIELGGLPGLPIGPEFSGLIGNVMLTGVDQALAPLVLAHVRVSDDSRVFVSDESAWEEIVGAYMEEASRLGLSLNEPKSSLYMKASGDALREIKNERIDYLRECGQGTLDPEIAADEIEAQVKSDSPDWTVINFGIGALIRNQSTTGLPIIYDNPSILQKTPTQTGRYLLSLAANGKCKKFIDRDWLIQYATEPFKDRSSVGKEIAGKIHACRVAERLNINKNYGKLLEELAMANDCNRDIPLKAWAAKAWGSSSAYRPETAVDHADSVGDFSLRRAFVLTIKPSDSTGQNRQKWIRHLNIREPDLKPSLARLR